MPANWPQDKKGKPKMGGCEVVEFSKLSDMDFEGWIKGVDTPDGCKAEVCSAFTKASARGLAKLGVFFANKGQSNGNTLISEGGVEALNSEPIMMTELTGNPTNFTKGGMQLHVDLPNSNCPKNAYTHPLMEHAGTMCMENRIGYYGWFGMGGSIFQTHPENNISFAYVPFDSFGMDMMNVRNSIIQKKVCEIVEKLGQ